MMNDRHHDEDRRYRRARGGLAVAFLALALLAAAGSSDSAARPAPAEEVSADAGRQLPRQQQQQQPSPAQPSPLRPEPMVDLLAVPAAGRPRNSVGTDGLGLCVFTSIQYAAWWQGEKRLKDFQAQMRRERGGGVPKKVDAMIAKYAPGVPYVQYQGNNAGIIELALKTGRLPCITWNGNHMLNCVYLDARQMAVVDNNAPNVVRWYSRDEGLNRWRTGGSGWVVVLLAPPPPPPPRSLQPGPTPPTPVPVVATATAAAAAAAGRPCPIIVPGPPPKNDGEEDGGGEGGGGCHGMDWKPAAGASPCWSREGGRPSTWDEVTMRLVDDSHKIHFTVIGSPEETAPAVAALPQALKDRYHVQQYTPDAWEVVNCGFVLTGKPTVYLQDRQGRVLLRQDGAVVQAELAAALRRADPGYDPGKDPSGRPAALVDWKKLKDWGRANQQTLLLGGGGLAALYWLSRQQQQQQQQQQGEKKPAAAATAPAPTAEDRMVARVLAALEQQKQQQQQKAARAAATTTTTTTTEGR